MGKGKIWIDGGLVKWDEARIHILTHGLHYGTGVFEGIRCYNTGTGLAVFRLKDHIQRFMESGRIYYMDLRYTKEQLQKAVLMTIKANGVEEFYVRPIAYYGFGRMGVNPLPNKVSVAIAVWKWDDYLTGGGREKGLRLIVSSWMRLDGRSMPIHAKATANYANSALARIEALKEGFDEAVMLNSRGKVIEASAENIFIVKDDILITPPIASGALRGITRDSVLTLANSIKISSSTSDISRDELYTADEVFLTGTAAGIKPVREIDGRTVGNGKIGPVTKRLRTKFEAVVHGKDENFSTKWLTLLKENITDN
jgi:branched-chain amino acid aminotransferase